MSLSIYICILMAISWSSSITAGSSKFPMAFFDSIYAKKSDSIFVSPINLHASLAVLGLASKGSTQKEILALTADKTEHLEENLLLPKNLSIATQDRQIYVGKIDVDVSFSKRLSAAYSFKNVEFGPRNTTKQVNYRVGDVTRKWVGDILPNSMNRDTGLVAVNALYVYAKWKKEFTGTMLRGFKKPMVHQYGEFLFGNLTDLNAAGLILEFEDMTPKLLVLQPNDNNIVRLTDQLINVDLSEISKRLKPTYMSLFFPIIKEIKMSASVKDALSTLGLDRTLSEKANFNQVLDTCEEELGIILKEVRQHTSFKSGRESARFVSVTGLQLDMVENKNKRTACGCTPNEFLTEFANPDTLTEKLSLAERNRNAPNYYFDQKLFLALIDGDQILFVGTVAKDRK